MIVRSVSATLVEPLVAEAGERVSCESGERDQPESLRPLKMLVYSHDTFGLGNIRRIMASASTSGHGFLESRCWY